MPALASVRGPIDSFPAYCAVRYHAPVNARARSRLTRSGTGTTPAPFGLLLAFFTVSGAVALTAEVVWIRQFTVLFGSTVESAATVTAVFLGGLGAGAAAWGHRADVARQPLFLWASLEAMGGLLALGGFFLLPALRQLVLAVPIFASAQAPGGVSARILVAVICVGPATFCMGGTLPALARAVAGKDERGRRAAYLYAANTLGAMGGVLAAGLVMIPRLGLQGTIAVATGSALGVAWTGFTLSRRFPRAPSAGKTAHGEGQRTAVGLAPVLFLIGAATLALEVAAVRLMSLLLGSSGHAVALVLAAFILSLALGAWAAPLLARSAGVAASRLPIAAGLGALGSGAVIFLVERAPYMVAAFMERSATDYSLVLLFDFALTLGLFLAPVVCLGTLFPFAMIASVRAEGKVGQTVGILCAADTAGCIVGSLAAGFVLIPNLGVVRSVAAASVLAAVAALLAARCVTGFFRSTLRSTVAISTVTISLFALLFARIDPKLLHSGAYLYAGARPDKSGAAGFWQELEGREVLFSRDGRESSVAVTTWAGGASLGLQVNGKYDASNETADLPTQVLLAQVPMLLHRSPQDILVVGLGSGVTAGSALTHKTVRTVTCVEIEPAVVRAARFFDVWNGRCLDDPRMEVVVDDARAMIAAPGPRYDIIISEPSNPWMAGIANLFTREFFEDVRGRLRPGGVVCQWVQPYDFSPRTFGLILRTFLSVFPDASLWYTAPIIGDFLLISGRDSTVIPDHRRVEAAFREEAVRRDLARAWLGKPADFYLRSLATSDILRRMSGEGPIHTDGRPVLDDWAARERGDLSHTPTIVALVANGRPQHPPAIVALPAAEARALEKLWAARGVFIESLSLHARGDHKQAARLTRRAAEMNSNDWDARRVAAERLLEQGLTAYKRGYSARAESLFWRGAAADSSYASPHALLAELAQRSGDLLEAERRYRVYVSLNPYDPKALLSFAECLSALGRGAEAAEMKRRGEALLPKPVR